jgi:hypothetical protein
VKFSLNKFWKFCAELSINSKEAGSVRLKKPFGPQRWFMLQLADALENDIHNLTVLKSRQIGLSTISLALDLYWVFTHEGLDGSIITHDDPAHQSFRTQLEDYYHNLPKSWKPQKLSHNRNEFVFRLPSGKISRLQYQVAGTRTKGGGALGRSKGNAFLHATEMSSWGDQEGLQSLRASLAEINPNRLYVWESTARGFNGFYDIWKEAQAAVTQRAVFVSWWAHELYRIPRDDQRYKVYFGVDGKLTKDEKNAAHDVALLYGDAMEYVNGTREISDEQWAWYRWYASERIGDETMLQQEMPHTAEQAFIVSGSQFFRGRGLAQAFKQIERDPAPQYLRVEIAGTMLDTKVLEVPKKVANLLIWEAPVAKAHYCLGADPAYGSSDWADRFCLSVWRCYADRIEQVAEFCDPGFLPYSFAWVLCYLAGCYGDCYWNLEVNGPGATVMQEIDNLRKQSYLGSRGNESAVALRNFTGGMRQFLWKRVDTVAGVASARGTKSTYQEKDDYMHTYRDYFSRGIAVVHSRELIEEMKNIVKEEGSAPAASGRAKDDRVIAAALAVQMWQKKMLINLMRAGITYEKTGPKAAGNAPSPRRTVLEDLARRRAQLVGMKPPA